MKCDVIGNVFIFFFGLPKTAYPGTKKAGIITL